MAAEYPPRDRLSLRAYIRARLRGRGLLEFVDDDEERRRRIELVYMNSDYAWCEDAFSKRVLRLDALLATSTDMPVQGIGNTVHDNDEFWSSTGSANGTTGEALLYRLRQPLSRVAYVSIAVYRAFYQHGDPLYPPCKVSFLTGPSPNQLYPASPLYPVRLTDDVQIFALSSTAAVTQYLMVRMHGRLQRQWEDLQLYIAIRHVAAYGDPVDTSYSLKVARLVRSNLFVWPCTRGLMSAMVTSGVVDSNDEDPTCSARGGTRHGNGADVAPGTPSTVHWRQAGIDSTGDQMLAEDVYEVGPRSLLESRRAYTATALCRGKTRASLSSKHVNDTAEEKEPVLTVRYCLPPGDSAVHPSGPTESELRLAVQDLALLRALPHLVKVPWPTLLVGRQHSVAPKQHKQQWEESWLGDTVSRSLASGGTGDDKRIEMLARYFYRTCTQGAQVCTNEAAATAASSTGPFAKLFHKGPALHNRAGVLTNTRNGSVDDNNESAARSTAAVRQRQETTSRPGALQRLRDWVIAAARGTTAAVEAVDPNPEADANVDADDALRIADARARIHRRLFGPVNNNSALGGALPSGSLSSAGLPATNVRQQASVDEEEVSAALGRLREDLPPRGGNSSLARAIAGPSAVAISHPARGTAEDQLLVGGQPNVTAAYLCNSADRVDGGLLLGTRVSHQQRSSRPALRADNLAYSRDRRHQLEREGQHQQQNTGRRAVTVVNDMDASMSGFSALHHKRPEQSLPPPKLRRRGDAGLDGISATGNAVTDGRDEVQRWRQQWHLRAAQRAMQPALYSPHRNNALFVMLDSLAGAGRGSDTNNDGCWLVSHYDHEHL